MSVSPRVRRVLFGVLFIPLASAAGVEIGSRILDRARGKPWDPQAARASIEKAIWALSRRKRLPSESGGNAKADPGTAWEPATLEPYVGWGYPSTQTRVADEIDYYGTPEAEQVFDICILGGSVAFYFANEGKERLTEGLRKDARFRDRELRIHNFADAGDKQFQPLMILAYHLALGHRPDAVIELDGFNESALGWSNAKTGVHPMYPYLPMWADATSGLRTDWEIVGLLFAIRSSQEEGSAFAKWFLESGLWRSSFLGHVGEARLQRLRRRYTDAFERYSEHLKSRPKTAGTNGPRFPKDDAAIADMIAAAWEEASVNMHGMCARRGISYLHVLQPTLHDKGLKPLTTKEIEGGGAQSDWIAGVEAVYPKLRDAGRRLATRGTPYLDATNAFLDHPEDIYYDVCHVNQAGNDILADAVASAMLRDAAR